MNRAYGTWTGKGDSGGPILIDTGKGLVQVGVVSGTAQDDEQQTFLQPSRPGIKPLALDLINHWNCLC